MTAFSLAGSRRAGSRAAPVSTPVDVALGGDGGDGGGGGGGGKDGGGS